MGHLPEAKKAQLWVDILLAQKKGPALLKKYDISGTTLTTHRRKVRELLGTEGAKNLSVLMETLQRELIGDLEHVRDIVMDALDRAVEDPKNFDLRRAIDDALKSCQARAMIFQRAAVYIDAHSETTNINVVQVQQQAQGDVMKKILDATGPDDKPLLSKESRLRILAMFAKPVGGNKT